MEMKYDTFLIKKPRKNRIKILYNLYLIFLLQGAFPPPCGPESLFSLLDEKSLLKYCKGNSIPEVGSPFKYFVLDNSIIVGLLEQPLGNVEGWLLYIYCIVIYLLSNSIIQYKHEYVQTIQMNH